MIVNNYLIAAVQNDSYLKHHGIDGQRWGHRNGPPYPLGSSQYSSEERKLNKGKFNVGKTIKRGVRKTVDTVRAIDRKYKNYKRNKDYKDIQKKKHKILTSGNREEIYKNRALFTNDELDAIVTRLEKEDKLKNMMSTPVKIIEKTESKKINEGYEKTKNMINEIAFWSGKASSLVKDTYTIAENGKKLYNVYANYKNTAGPFDSMQKINGEYKYIREHERDKDKDKKEDD